ncbi:hypothetical protein [Streptomyces sp. NPDC056492]|uniref:hypothetical protein n=1 Tax=unclassified Streptomyces TaxID=2593676 RepID=UPI0036A069D2
MSESGLSEYVAMWTTERDRWELHRVGDVYLPITKGDQPVVQAICDDALADEVTTRMLQAGVTVVDVSK